MDTSGLIYYGYMSYVAIMCLIVIYGTLVFKDYLVTTLVFAIGMLLFISTAIKSLYINYGLAACASLLVLVGIVRGIKKLKRRS